MTNFQFSGTHNIFNYFGNSGIYLKRSKIKGSHYFTNFNPAQWLTEYFKYDIFDKIK